MLPNLKKVAWKPKNEMQNLILQISDIYLLVNAIQPAVVSSITYV